MGTELILLVEDDPANQLLTRTVLEEAGYYVLAASTAQEARELLRFELPDLVLLDLRLPDEDGLSLMAEVAEHPRTAGVPIVALTGSAFPAMREAAYAAGCSDYLVKPIDIRELEARVAANLRRGAGRRRSRPA
jgi:two-component system cell cycle response regulator DivK